MNLDDEMVFGFDWYILICTCFCGRAIPSSCPEVQRRHKFCGQKYTCGNLGTLMQLKAAERSTRTPRPLGSPIGKDVDSEAPDTNPESKTHRASCIAAGPCNAQPTPKAMPSRAPPSGAEGGSGTESGGEELISFELPKAGSTRPKVALEVDVMLDM